MLIWAILATIASIILAVILTAYRRQVKDTCRHMAFISKNDTNMLLPSKLPFKELESLNKSLNELLESIQKIKAEQAAGDKRFKESITNISHDIRTPLTSLNGYFKLLSKTESDEERKRYIGIIDERIESLKYMLDELFTYTKLKNESFELVTEKTDFSKCICDTLLSFYENINKMGIEPEIDFCEEKIFVKGNREAIKRIVQNLIKNALEHGNGKLRLTMKHEKESAIFTCSNNIESNEEIDLSQIFSRFYKADPARTHSSTGLGLAIAKELAQQMNGEISAEINDNMFCVKFIMK